MERQFVVAAAVVSFFVEILAVSHEDTFDHCAAAGYVSSSLKD